MMYQNGVTKIAWQFTPGRQRAWYQLPDKNTKPLILKPLILNLTLGTNVIEQVREHRVLGITIDEELKWQPHIDNICKQVARKIFLLGQLRKYVDIDCRKLFFNAHLMAHINYASTVWSNANEVHLKKLNSLHRRAAKLILPDHSLSTTAKLKKIRHSSTAGTICVQHRCAYV